MSNQQFEVSARQKISNARAMFGPGSRQHLAAMDRFGLAAVRESHPVGARVSCEHFGRLAYGTVVDHEHVGWTRIPMPVVDFSESRLHGRVAMLADQLTVI